MRILAVKMYFHDSNVSYFDGEKLHYLKSERYFNEKHHALKTFDEVELLIKNVWGITFNDVDQIVFCDPSAYNAYPGKNKNIIEHHYAHVLSTAMFSELDVSFVLDGRGGRNAWSVFRGDQLIKTELIEEVGSIGYGITYLAECLGIKGHTFDLAGKLMGYQSYGKVDAEYLKALSRYDISSVGIYYKGRWLNQNKLFAHNPELALLDWAATIHARCGEIILETFQKYADVNSRIGYSGGVAQNIVWNTMLRKHFPNLMIMPHCGDEGLSLGGIELLRRKNKMPRIEPVDFPFSQADEAVPETRDEILKAMAVMLSLGKTVAWYQGKGEVGPRALGHRSILLDPRIKNGKDKINRIKHREHYRPFGGSVLLEHSKDWFDLNYENPYMLYVAKPKQPLPAITHVDNTCRIQTVANGSFHKLLTIFHELTGCPVLLNTSLNKSGKPIVGTVKEALDEFNQKDIDYLVVGNKIYLS